MKKDELRKSMSMKRNSLLKEAVKENSIKIFDRLTTIEAFTNAKQMLTYINLKNEVNTEGIINYCWNHNKKTVAPKVIDSEMEFYYFNKYEELKIGKFNILEPETTHKYIYNLGDVIIIPGLAFDTFGGRVGYGGGFYDKYLSKNSTLVKIAIAYDFQILNTKIEVDEYDIKPDYIVTENRIIKIY